METAQSPFMYTTECEQAPNKNVIWFGHVKKMVRWQQMNHSFVEGQNIHITNNFPFRQLRCIVLNYGSTCWWFRIQTAIYHVKWWGGKFCIFIDRHFEVTQQASQNPKVIFQNRLSLADGTVVQTFFWPGSASPRVLLHRRFAGLLLPLRPGWWVRASS